MSTNLPTASNLPGAHTPSLNYQARHFAPVILALSKCGVPGYTLAIVLGQSVGLLHRPEPLLVLLLVLVVIVIVAQRYRHTGIWGLLAFTHLLAREVVIITFDHQAGFQWVLPAFYLMPLATSPV